MAQVHYLNVKNGDCSFIKHNDGAISVIDVNNAYLENQLKLNENLKYAVERAYTELQTKGNFNQKDYPVNPIDYLKIHSITSVFRFILTHPDMDHMDGIKEFFQVFSPINFWDTENTKELPNLSSGRFSESDWEFYQLLKSGKGNTNRLTLLDGASNKFFNQDTHGKTGGHGLHILAPTTELIDMANETENWNDSSYVILYRTHNRKILFGGDADTNTWQHLLDNHLKDIEDVDLLIAPHHGRKSGCSYDFLRAVRPKVTFFGNAEKATHLAHEKFNNLGLYKITNNQGNCLLADINDKGLHVYVTNKRFAESENPNTFYNEEIKGWYIKSV